MDRERKAAYDRARRLANPEAKRASSRAYYLANREKRNAQSRAWAEAHPAETQAIRKRWVAANAEVVRERRRQRHAEDPSLARFRINAYRALRRGAQADLTVDEWQDITREFDYRCAYCNAADVPLEIEHMTPLSRGGKHTASNVVPACRSCNASKGARTAFEFAGRPSQPSQGALLS